MYDEFPTYTDYRPLLRVSSLEICIYLDEVYKTEVVKEEFYQYILEYASRN